MKPWISPQLDTSSGFEAAASLRSSMVDILNNAYLRKKLIISVVRNLEAVSVQITDESLRLEPLV